jgi:aldehyde:ferredoxin oxidoreductase
MFGYSGKILHIDLTERKTWVEEKPEDWYKTWIGGVSMATRLCWENIKPGCDAYSPDNPVCIANGIFAVGFLVHHRAQARQLGWRGDPRRQREMGERFHR